jgi:hypothetical protein
MGRAHLHVEQIAELVNLAVLGLLELGRVLNLVGDLVRLQRRAGGTKSMVSSMIRRGRAAEERRMRVRPTFFSTTLEATISS